MHSWKNATPISNNSLNSPEPMDPNKTHESFAHALISRTQTLSHIIPPELDFFGPLIGHWDIEYVDGLGTPGERHVRGEWIFSRVLAGTAIQDVFICPSREQWEISPQADAEYGTTIRIYNPVSRAWDVFYGCTGAAVRLEARREENDIVLTEVTMGRMRWIFSDIAAASFHWQNTERMDDGTVRINCEVFATRRK